jgi:hypothetical protein
MDKCTFCYHRRYVPVFSMISFAEQPNWTGVVWKPVCAHPKVGITGLVETPRDGFLMPELSPTGDCPLDSESEVMPKQE